MVMQAVKQSLLNCRNWQQIFKLEKPITGELLVVREKGV